MNTLGLAPAPEEQPSVIQGPSQSPHEKDTIRIGELLSIVWRQKRVMVGVIVIIMILAIVALNSVTPRYTASSLVEINPRQTQIVDFDSVLTGLTTDDETIQTEIKIIESRRLAMRTIERLELHRNPEFNPALRAEGLIASWRRAAADWLAAMVSEGEVDPENAAANEGAAAGAVEGTDGGAVEGTDGAAVEGANEGANEGAIEGADEAREPAGFLDQQNMRLAHALRPAQERDLADDELVAQEMERTVDEFLQNLIVKPESRSRVIRISFESTDPSLSAEIANTIADFYIVSQLEAKFEATKRATNWLNERVGQLREEVVAKERAIEEYRAKSGLLQGGGPTTLTSEQVSELNTQHVLELARLAEAQARLRQMNELLKSPKGIESAGEVLQSQLILDLRRSESELERQIAELAEEYGDRHPTMINARAELRDLRQKIQIEVDRIVQGLRNEVEIARARASSLRTSLEKAKSEVAQLNQAEVDLRALERDASAARTLLETLLQRTKQTASQETFQEADANVVSYAPVPREPSFPLKGLSLIVSFIGALVMGVLCALILDQRDHGFRSSEQITHQLGVRSLGLLPRVSKLETRGKPVHEYVMTHPESALAEGIRTLFTNVLLSDVAKRPNVILITSTLPHEGKTSVSLSLACLMASVGHRVIVVDCDLRRPCIHKELGLASGPGLVECLTSDIRIEDVIEKHEASGIHVLRAGQAIHNSPEQLDSPPMQQLLRTLSRRYDLVILDSAPLLAVSDTLFVSRLADKTVLLIRWSQTRRAAATMALKQLQNAKAVVAGVMLTMVDVKANAKYAYGDSGLYQGALKKYYTK